MLAALGSTAIILLSAGVLFLVWVATTWNRFVRHENKVAEAFSGVDVQLKRRHDLVPNLVRVVKAYAEHEQETLTEVIEARSAAQAASEIPDRARREEGLSRSVGRLIALVERYPQLKADGNFRKLHGDLVEIEDDLQYARRYFNGATRDFNNAVETFPSNILAGLFGKKTKPFFELDTEGERAVPRVDWSDDA